MRQAYVYILANQKNGTLYIGVTNNLARRAFEHRTKLFDGFAKRYEVKRLVYYEVFDHVGAAIKREKQLKGWHRSWKINLIKKQNPEWKDLYDYLNR